MKNKIWQIIKTKRFLYALLYSVALIAYMSLSATLFKWLIPYKLLVVVVWFIALATVMFITGFKFVKFLDKKL